MILATLARSAAAVLIAVIAGLSLVLSVLVWSISCTGRPATRREGRYRERVEDRPAQARAERSGP